MAMFKAYGTYARVYNHSKYLLSSYKRKTPHLYIRFKRPNNLPLFLQVILNLLNRVLASVELHVKVSKRILSTFRY